MSKAKPKPTKIIETFVADINSVQHSPRFQIIVSNCILELLVNTLVEIKCKNAKSKNFSYANKLVLLHELKLIDDFYFVALDAFRDMRNAAAHEIHFQLTADMLKAFKGQVATLRTQKLDDPQHFTILCGEVVMGFWNCGVRLFAPIFEPHLFPKS